MECNENIVVPTLPTDPCNGERGNIKCQFSEDAYTLLEIPANSSLDVILNAFVLALNSAFTTNQAQQVVIDSLSNPQQPYKVYRALLTQTGSADPTAVILENTLGESIIWKRSTTGGYTAEKTSGFDITKTFYNTNGFATTNIQLVSFINTINSKLVVSVRDTISNLPIDAQLSNTPIEILVYE
jgi:hypothetical protein